MELKFECPNKFCQGDRLESIEENIVASSIITHFGEEGDFDYGTPSLEDGNVCRFQCLQCGHILTYEDGNNLTENTELVEWLQKQEYNQ